MKKLSRILRVVLFGGLLSLMPVVASAEVAQYESNGQAGFYGTYEYETKDKNEEGDSLSDTESNGKHASANRLKDRSVNGRSRLPNTGTTKNPIYFWLGLLLCVGIIYLIKRKEAFL